MKKILAAIIPCVLALGAAQAQTVVLQQDVNQDTIQSNWGPNKKHYKHFYFGYGLGIGTENRTWNGTDVKDIKYGFGTNTLMVGWRYKLRLAEHYAIGLDVNYNRQAYRFKQTDHKVFPMPGKYDKERLALHNFALEFYNRINFGRRGNHLGTFVDLGAYGEWNFNNSLLIEGDFGPGINRAKSYKTKLKDLNYVNDLNYGLSLRAGYDRFAIFGKYRLSDMFDDKKTGNYPELPRLHVGLQIRI